MENRNRKPKQDPFWIVKALIVLAIVLAAIILIAEGKQEEPLPTQPVQPEATDETVPTLSDEYESQMMTYAEMAMGDLVLVNAEHGIDPGYVVVEGLYQQATDSYYVKDYEIAVQKHLIDPLNRWMDEFYAETGINDALIVAGHRTVEYQQYLYDRAVENHGQAHADAYIALPGHSEHHTGLAIDFDTYTDQGILGGFDGEGEFRQIVEQAWQYGFVQRYPPNKSDVTGISYEAWHFRHVGLPHSGIMTDRGLCLEEYIALLKDYPYDGQHLEAEYLGKRYEVYYCQGLQVVVPTNRAYTVSGNNVDGFIVTVEI